MLGTALHVLQATPLMCAVTVTSRDAVYNKPSAQPGSRRVRLDDEPLERQVGREELMLEHRHRKGFEREKQRASRVFFFL